MLDYWLNCDNLSNISKISYYNYCCFILVLQDKSRETKSQGKNLAPRIVSHVESAVVNDGDPVTLSCRIIGM